MATTYTFKPSGNNVEVYKNGGLISTTTPNQAALQYGYSGASGQQQTGFDYTQQQGVATQVGGVTTNQTPTSPTPSSAPVPQPPAVYNNQGYVNSTPMNKGTDAQGKPVQIGNPQLNPQFFYTGQQTPTPKVDNSNPQATPQPIQAGQSTVSGEKTGAQAQQAAQSGALVMPQTGSVVDLLNMAGQDSSFAARQQLSTQFGIQNYSGTAAQNQELSKKYLAAYNASKGQATPQNAAEGRAAVTGLMQAEQQVANPIAQFMDVYGSMNPIEASIFQQLSGFLSTTNTQQSLTDFYKQEIAAQGIPELNMELADINRIMDGTEDDIRDEITAAGGFTTESQVQALTGARNKTLLKKANYLSDVINAKNDYVDNIVALTKADREQVSKDLDQKLGITKMMFDMSQSMTKSAKENYQMIVDSVGWEGLAQSLKGSPTQMAKVEKLFGLAPGQINALAAYKKPLTEMEELEKINKELQNQKLRAEIGKMSLSDMTPANKELAMSLQQQTIMDTNALLDSPGLNSAVGPNFLSRIALADAFGAKSNFIASVEQLRTQLTLDKLISAKGSGATFGALSDAELQLLAASASKLGTWAQKDDAGNITGYQVDENSFKKELDKISSFQKLDYILKGGDPESAGVHEMADGTLWVQNSDGSYTQIR